MNGNFAALLLCEPETEHVDFFEYRWRYLNGPVERGSSTRARQEKSMIEKQLLVSVVDDDESVRESLPDLLRELGFAARVFSSAEEFLASDAIGRTSCLILDIAMPGMGGPALKRKLDHRQPTIPVIFITARKDDAVRAHLLEDGAVECLFKPFSDTALLEALSMALPNK